MDTKKKKKETTELDDFVATLERLRIPYSKCAGILDSYRGNKRTHTTISISQAHFVFGLGKFESVDDDEMGGSHQRVPDGKPCGEHK